MYSEAQREGGETEISKSLDGGGCEVPVFVVVCRSPSLRDIISADPAAIPPCLSGAGSESAPQVNSSFEATSYSNRCIDESLFPMNRWQYPERSEKGC